MPAENAALTVWNGRSCYNKVMQVRDYKSIIIISLYSIVNLILIVLALKQEPKNVLDARKSGRVAPEYTIIENLNYFHLKGNIPELSLAADFMKSQGEDLAEFEVPKGIYKLQSRDKTIRYQALNAVYKKDKELLTLNRSVKITSDEGEYTGEKIRYFFKRDLIIGTDGVHFVGEDLKTKDHLDIQSDSMKAYPQNQYSLFKGQVRGFMLRKKKYEGKLTFSSQELQMDGQKSLAHLEGDVMMKRDNYLVTGGKADIYLENFNKSLKYFVLNDDVKLTETLQTPTGVTQRKAFSERLEAFAKEQKMVLSGAPRVEMGTDVVKGYRITIRENVDLIEVDDAMSDVQMKQKKLKE
jgi:lipopolysaccharide export system protein LptA